MANLQSPRGHDPADRLRELEAAVEYERRTKDLALEKLQQLLVVSKLLKERLDQSDREHQKQIERLHGEVDYCHLSEPLYTSLFRTLSSTSHRIFPHRFSLRSLGHGGCPAHQLQQLKSARYHSHSSLGRLCEA